MTNALFAKIKEIEQAVGKDWLNKFQQAETVEDIIALAEIHEIRVTEEIALEALQILKETELSDEQLMDVSGGIRMVLPKK